MAKPRLALLRELFGTRVRIALEEKRLKQAQLAKRAKLTNSQLSLYISGNKEPRLDAVEAIARALDVHPAFLLWGETANKTTTKGESI